MTTAADRLQSLDTLPAADLCTQAGETLGALVEIMNRETTFLRSGQFHSAAELAAEKTQLAQDYVTFARAVRRQGVRLKSEAPAQFERLKAHHESLATQMAENLRVLATARSVTEDILSDVAQSVGNASAPNTYGANGQLPSAGETTPARGLSLNRSL